MLMMRRIAVWCCVSLLLTTGFASKAPDDEASLERLGVLEASVQSLQQQLHRLQSLLEPDGASQRAASCASLSAVSINPSALSRDGSEPAGLEDRRRRTYATRRASWGASMAFHVAVKPAARPTAAFLMSDLLAGYARYYVLGDVAGTLYVFSPGGDLLGEFGTDGASPITAIAHERVMGNRSSVVTGHADGCVRTHTMTELFRSRDRPTQQHAVAAFEPKPAATYCPPADAPADARASVRAIVAGSTVTRGRNNLLLAATERGEVVVLFGGAPYVVTSNSSILHVWYSHRQIRAITEDGVATAVLHSNATRFKPMSCLGLNGTRLTAGISDVGRQGANRAFAVSAEGELLHFAFGGDKRIVTCRVRLRQPLTQPGEPVAMTVVKNHLVVATPRTVTVLNTTLSLSLPTKPWIAEPLDSLSQQFGLQQRTPSDRPPLLVSNGQVLLLELAEEVVALFAPPIVHVPVTFDVSILAWTRPLMILVMIGVAVWQFTRARSVTTSGYVPRRPMPPGRYSQGAGRIAGGGFGGGRMASPGMDPEMQRLLAEYAARGGD